MSWGCMSAVNCGNHALHPAAARPQVPRWVQRGCWGQVDLAEVMPPGCRLAVMKTCPGPQLLDFASLMLGDRGASIAQRTWGSHGSGWDRGPSFVLRRQSPGKQRPL